MKFIVKIRERMGNSSQMEEVGSRRWGMSSVGLAVVAAVCVGLLLSATGGPSEAAVVRPDGWTAGPDKGWKVFWNDALDEARKSGKKIFVLSTGSDWCGWCKKLKQDVFEKDEFMAYAKEKLILLYLDSPRKPLPADQKLHNDKVGGTLGFGGGVPCAAVFDVDSRRYGVISGYSKTPAEYIARIDKVLAQPGEMPKGGAAPELFAKGYVAPAKGAIDPVRRASSPSRVPKQPGYKSETVDGVEWWYCVSNGMAVVEAPSRIHGRARVWWRESAITNATVGCVSVPEKLGGMMVGRIGERAFYGCSKLTRVVVPAGVTSLGDEAFDYCSALTEVSLPDGISVVGNSAFSQCTNLTTVTVPSSLKHIGRNAFSWCGRLAAFSLPADCVSIGAEAFVRCDALTEMKIPASVREIGQRAFSSCARLKSFAVDGRNATFSADGGNLYNKDGTVLLGCPCAGRIVRISASVTNVSDTAIRDMGSARAIEVDSTNAVYRSVGGCLYDKDMSRFVRCPDVVEQDIPMGIACIGPDAFSGLMNLSRVSVPTSVVEIGERAFNACTNLTQVTIPAGVTNIGYGAFQSCKSLETITVPSSVKAIRMHTFTHCCRLKSVVLMPGVESIGCQAFFQCQRLSYVRIPSSVWLIGKNSESERGYYAAGTFETLGPQHLGSQRLPLACDELVIVVDKGEEDRFRSMLLSELYERTQRVARSRGFKSKAIKVMTEDEYRLLNRSAGSAADGK